MKGFEITQGGVKMYDSIQQCHICKKDYTSMHVEIRPGLFVYACSACFEKAKDNFIWICVNCGRSYFRPKRAILNRLRKYGVNNAGLLCEGVQLILGIDICIECDPQGIVEYVKSGRFEMEVGAC